MLKIFYSLNSVDLPEFFEDHMNEWMTLFRKFLLYETKLTQLIGDPVRVLIQLCLLLIFFEGRRWMWIVASSAICHLWQSESLYWQIWRRVCSLLWDLCEGCMDSISQNSTWFQIRSSKELSLLLLLLIVFFKACNCWNSILDFGMHKCSLFSIQSTRSIEDDVGKYRHSQHEVERSRLGTLWRQSTRIHSKRYWRIRHWHQKKSCHWTR